MEASYEPTRSTAAPVDFDAVARIASRVQITSVKLVGCNAEIAVPAEELASDWGGSVFIGHWAHVHGWRHDESGTSPEAVLVRVAFVGVHHPAWELHAMEELPPYDANDPPAVLLEVMFELDYQLHEHGTKLNPDDLEQFAFTNATFNAWPYWREFAQSMTQRMGIPPVVVPVFKIPSAHDDE